MPATRTAAGRRVRDKEATRRRLIEAAGRVMARDGFRSLGVNAVAREAGCDKVLIYRYFGGLDGLVRAYAEDGDFWPGVDELIGEPEESYRARTPGEQTGRVLRNLMRALGRRPVTLQILAWELVERNDLTEHLERVRARLGQEFTRRFGHAGPADIDLQALVTLLAGAAQYVVAKSRVTPVFNGIDLSTPDGARRLENAMEAVCRRMLDG